MLSDLHLGARSGNDLLRRPAVRARLLSALEDVERVVLLGDVLELRERELDEGVALAQPFFEELGEALGGGQVIVVPGNHDRLLADPVVAAAGGAEALELEARVPPDPHHPLGTVAACMGDATLALAYPGLWLAPGVYATHGHYLDLHSSVPTFERLALAASARVVGEIPPEGATPADYERVAAPVYRAATALGQMSRPGGAALGADVSARAWGRLRAGDADGGGSGVGVRLLAGALPGAVAAVNRLGLGPFTADFSPPTMRRSGLESMAEAARRLGVDADVLLFGHIHRAGPLEGEDPWVTPGGARLVNAGNWVYEPAFVEGPPGASPYWPGTWVVLDGRGYPRVESLLADAPHEELRAEAA